MSRTFGGRGLLVVGLILVFLAVVADLLRPESLILGIWRDPGTPQTPIERAVKDFTKGRQEPPPRSNRVEGRGTRGVMSGAHSPSVG